MNPEDKEYPINEETRRKYRITSYPAVLFVSPDGGLIQKASGLILPKEFLPIMREALAKEEAFSKQLAKLKQHPKDAKLNAQVALTYIERQQLGNAVSYSEKAFAEDPKNRTKLIPDLHSQLGLAYGGELERAMSENTGQAEIFFAKAVSHLKTVIDTYPKSDVYELAQYYLGVVHNVKGNVEEAISLFEKLARHAKNKEIKQYAEVMLKRIKN